MNDAFARELAPGGVLRAGINLGNPLLVTGTAPNGDPEGVAPDMARAIADRLNARISYVTFATPGELADAAEDDRWDVGLIAEEAKRAETIAFSPAYCEIEATYLVPEGSAIRSVDEADRPGVRIAISARSAFDLYLSRTLKHAELKRVQGLSASLDLFVAERLDALAGLRPGLVESAAKVPGSRVLDGRFMAVQQAIGTQRTKPAAAAFLRDFVDEAKASGLVAALIERHGMTGRLLVAAPG